VFDVLALRGTEGKAELIPRQEYEYVSFTMEMLRYPEIFKLMVDRQGVNGLIDIGTSSRKELGTKINNVHQWCLLTVPLMGAVGLEQADFVDTTDPLYADKKRWTITGSSAILYGYRGEEGHILASQNRYVTKQKDQKVIDFVEDHLQSLNPAETAEFRQLNAASELLSFLIHYDCRLGLGDTGPYITEDGKPMIIRDHFINEPVYSWSKVSEDRDLPYCITLAFVLDPTDVGRGDDEQLQEIRVNDISTTFSKPDEYMQGVESVAVFARDDVETNEPLPLDDLRPVPVDEFGEIAARCNEAIEDWYRLTSKLPRRQKIMNGAWVYYIDMILPTLRRAGLYEELNENYDLWEVPPMSSDVYYTCMGELAQEVVPVNIMQGTGWQTIPEDLADTSEYAEYLENVREMGWQSDLSGMLDIPDDWESKMDENYIIQDVPITKMNP